VPQTFLAKTLDFNSNYFSFVCTNVAGPQESLSIGGVAVKYGTMRVAWHQAWLSHLSMVQAMPWPYAAP
jgi:hypothetical protein